MSVSRLHLAIFFTVRPANNITMVLRLPRITLTSSDEDIVESANSSPARRRQTARGISRHGSLNNRRPLLLLTAVLVVTNGCTRVASALSLGSSQTGSGLLVYCKGHGTRYAVIQTSLQELSQDEFDSIRYP